MKINRYDNGELVVEIESPQLLRISSETADEVLPVLVVDSNTIAIDRMKVTLRDGDARSIAMEIKRADEAAYRDLAVQARMPLIAYVAYWWRPQTTEYEIIERFRHFWPNLPDEYTLAFFDFEPNEDGYVIAYPDKYRIVFDEDRDAYIGIEDGGGYIASIWLPPRLVSAYVFEGSQLLPAGLAIGMPEGKKNRLGQIIT